MNNSIIQEITNLKRNYNNKNNTYEIIFLNNNEENNEKYFFNKLKNVIKQKWDDVKILDNKKYIQKDLILIIDTTGDMECINRAVELKDKIK